jgi:hypothetical protein
MREEFRHHVPNEDQIVRIQLLREGFSDLIDLIDDKTEPSRYSSLARTALEESAMWAIKSIVFED